MARAARPSGLVSSKRYSTRLAGRGTTTSATAPVRSSRAASASPIAFTFSSGSRRSHCATCPPSVPFVTTATFITSAGLFRNAIPRPPASRMGKTKVQKTASGSRRNSRARTSASCRSALVFTLSRGAVIAVSLIAQMPSGHRHKNVLQRGGVRAELRQRAILQGDRLQNQREGLMKLLHLHFEPAIVLAQAQHAGNGPQRTGIHGVVATGKREFHDVLGA